MRYFLDCEFDGYKGRLISLALVPLHKQFPEVYIATEYAISDPWVRDNVVPIIEAPGALPTYAPLEDFPKLIEDYLHPYQLIRIIADWPDDIRYLCENLITGPGTMIKSADLINFEVWRVDAYPTTLEGAVQHNALWDARALRHYYMALA